MKLSFGALARRALWELDGRSGLKAMRTPTGRPPRPPEVPAYALWRASLPEEHRLRRLPLPDPNRAVPQSPMPDWHREPNSGQVWPSDVHWTKALRANCGSLRLTWEPSRFAHVSDWVEARLPAAGQFEEQVLDWRGKNRFRAGVNWGSGQELALRSIEWLKGAWVYGPELEETTWRHLVELLYQHGVHLAAEFRFARDTVRNNHVISEGLGLAAIADAFPGFEEAAEWRASGLAAIHEALDEQFHADGGYCQCSHAYHHFALQLLVESWHWFEELRPVLRPVLERSIRFFEAVLEPGGVPNFGPNDRMVPPDYSLLLDQLYVLTGSERHERPTASSFPDAGLHVIRSERATATLRCGTLPERAGHDDGMHVEVWIDGVPLAIDAGSFLYGGPEHRWFAGAGSHNVCQVGGRTPRRLLSTFTWSGTATQRLDRFSDSEVVATYDCFTPVQWQRAVRVAAAVVTVEDELDAGGDETMRNLTLHWLIDAPAGEVEVVQDGRFTWNISTPGAQITIEAEPSSDGATATIVKNSAWRSLVYGSRDTVTSILVQVSAVEGRFRTTFEAR